jgi:hypothetical protein
MIGLIRLGEKPLGIGRSASSALLIFQNGHGFWSRRRLPAKHWCQIGAAGVFGADGRMGCWLIFGLTALAIPIVLFFGSAKKIKTG